MTERAKPAEDDIVALAAEAFGQLTNDEAWEVLLFICRLVDRRESGDWFSVYPVRHNAH